MARRLWRKLKLILINRVLRLKDTPHRIALGVLLGFIVGWTPTMGFQILIFLAVAAIFRANKIAGIVPIMLTNPITAIPIYVFNWQVGNAILNRDISTGSAAESELTRAFGEQPGLTEIMAQFYHPEFWQNCWMLLRSLGAELWIGCLVVGVITGTIGYAATYWGVVRFRQRPSRRSRRARAAAV